MHRSLGHKETAVCNAKHWWRRQEGNGRPPRRDWVTPLSRAGFPSVITPNKPECPVQPSKGWQKWGVWSGCWVPSFIPPVYKLSFGKYLVSGTAQHLTGPLVKFCWACQIPSNPWACVAESADEKISLFHPVNDLSTCTNQTSRQQKTWCHNSRRRPAVDLGSYNYGPFGLTSNAGWVYVLVHGAQPDFQKLTQQVNSQNCSNGTKGEAKALAFLGWHKAGRCGKPQLLHSPKFENMKRTTAFDLVCWMRLQASEKKMALETGFPNYLPITTYPSFHSSHISDSGFDMKVVWRWSPGGGKSVRVGKFRPQKCCKFSSG